MFVHSRVLVLAWSAGLLAGAVLAAAPRLKAGPFLAHSAHSLFGSVEVSQGLARPLG
jgi:hypothetical protein